MVMMTDTELTSYELYNDTTLYHRATEPKLQNSVHYTRSVHSKQISYFLTLRFTPVRIMCLLRVKYIITRLVK